MTTATKRRIDDARWLSTVRQDLDTNHADWIKPVDSNRISKLEAVTSYLDAILTELGHPPAPHRCPVCSLEHVKP